MTWSLLTMMQEVWSRWLIVRNGSYLQNMWMPAPEPIITASLVKPEASACHWKQKPPSAVWHHVQ